MKNLQLPETNKKIPEPNKNNVNENNNTKNSFNEEKPISLKYQHFETYIKKICKSPQINYIQSSHEIKKDDKFTNVNFLSRKDNILNFSFSNNPKNIKTKNIYNNLKTYYNTEKDLNLKNKNKINNNKPLFTTFNDTKTKKNIFLKSKILNEQKLQNIQINKIQETNKPNNNIQLKIKSKTPYKTFINKNNSNKSRNKSNLIPNKHHTQNSEGYLTRKKLNGIPYTFEPIMIYNNIYSTKSEKKRHEIILDDFIKLRPYIQRQPENKLKFIKEFLNKYYIEYEKYDKDKLISLCDFISYQDKNVISSFLKPYLDIKNMIIDLLNNIDTINKLLNNKKDEINEIKEEIQDKINYNEVYRYSSPNIIEDNLNCNNSDNFKIKFYTKENFRKNKFNNRYDNNLIEEEKILKDIKIKLRDLEHQKKLHIPDKNYKFRNDLIIKDMNKEMNILKNKFEQTLYNRSFQPKKKYNSQNNSKYYQKKNIEIPIIFSQFQKKPKNYEKIEEDILNLYIFRNKINKNNSSKFMLMKKEDNYNEINNKYNLINRYSMDEIIKRLYYKPMKIKFDINEVRKNNKITEYYALKLAKHNKFLKDINDNSYFLNLNKNNFCNIESENNILKDI